jgi:hypothetical protein
MEEDFRKINSSFYEERFEDTISLVNQGYDRLSEIESSQTTLKLYYDATTKSIKKFLVDNWKRIAAIFGIFLILLIAFWKTLKLVRVKRKISKLNLQKETLNRLIKKLQEGYFGSKKISETEFSVKMERFKEMIRDIDRQIPLLKEEIARLGDKYKK